MTSPRALGLDFDHTLGFDHGLEHRAFLSYAAALGCALDSDPAAAPAIERVLAELRGGRRAAEEAIPAFYRERCDARASAADWQAHCLALVPELVRPAEGAVDLLETLAARGIACAILTNGWSPLQQRKIAQALGSATPAIVLVSDRIGALKPARAAFDALVGALRLPREQIWYAGDNAAADVGGALAAGLGAVWVADGAASYPQNLPPPTATVRTLRELRALVENTKVP